MGETGPALRWWQSIPRHSLVFDGTVFLSVTKYSDGGVFLSITKYSGGGVLLSKYPQAFWWQSIFPKISLPAPDRIKSVGCGRLVVPIFYICTYRRGKDKSYCRKIAKKEFFQKATKQKHDCSVKLILSVLFSRIFVVAGDE